MAVVGGRSRDLGQLSLGRGLGLLFVGGQNCEHGQSCLGSGPGLPFSGQSGGQG